MKLSLSILIANLLLAQSVFSQKWIREETLAFTLTPSAWSVDTEYNVYVGFPDGSLRKFSPEGKELPVFSLPNQSAITLVDAQNNRKIFLFQRDIQKVSILDRFSTIPRQYELSDFDIEYAISSCLAPDGSIWTVEINPIRIKKIDPLRKNVILEVQHDSLGDSISFMRALQNLVFVGSENGMTILDQYGNHVSSIDSVRINYIQLAQRGIIASHAAGFLRINPEALSIQDEVIFPVGKVQALLDLNGKYAVLLNKSLSFYLIKDTD